MEALNETKSMWEDLMEFEDIKEEGLPLEAFLSLFRDLN
jgi:hypothetical protein